MFFDSHAHLYDEQFDPDRDELINSLRDKGISYVVVPGDSLETSKRAIELAKKYDFIYAAIGVHPHEVQEAEDDDLEEIKKLAKSSNKVVAIGEIGLDYYYDFSPRDMQKEWFIKQIELANELGLPFIVHDRDAHGDTFEIIKKYKGKNTGCVLHCYSGATELAKEYIKLGCKISIPGTLTFKNNKKTVEVVENIGLEHMFIETDSPYLAPVPMRGKRNNPEFVRYVAETISEIKRIDLETVAENTTKNAKEFFSIDK